jgi:glycerol-3-phosphate O-acyltransferase
MRANIKTLKAMEQLMVEGGHIIWIAPSGGRDRKAEDGTLKPDKFDPSAVEMMRKFGSKPKVTSRPSAPYSRRAHSLREAAA